MEQELLLRLTDVGLSYKSHDRKFIHNALKGVSFDVKSGEKIGILGRNGCGKSSLLRILAGIIDPSVGAVTCKKYITRSLLTLGIGFMPHVSGRDNALYSAMLNGVSKNKAKSLLSFIEDFSELGEFFDQPVYTYSSGMMARLGFATALITEVDILLLDEVLSVGDAHFRKKAESAMQMKIAGEQTIILVSHDSDQINNVCDRAIWINDGVIRDQGDAGDVAHNYNLFMQSLDASGNALT
jgi:lipopolysaccharide transport system ATP-binding protein